ncbi:hypothetical protein MM239_07125, partial [Belliella sp. DSM 111904]
MKEEFQEFTNKLVDEQKAILDQKPHTGTIANMSERLTLFQISIKILNEKLTDKANEFLSNTEHVYENSENLKDELQSVA